MTSVGGNRKFDITNSVSCRFHQVENFCSFCIKFFIDEGLVIILFFEFLRWTTVFEEFSNQKLWVV